ncbi:type IV toxin-antitoxin system AbiEi family antitoxin domain-containing protein [Desulfotignum balticum]|jgi:predicted transcriptional regulator of viral defense system|uniref:type IV toxin-antitoxin system AbiEi family antitoxin domain-containing protein n=1 Tax=Desulfotignum balticum TaxID=115781 RepID=UPI001FDEBF08|nr:type IV toxin-antitoxin system AbiEi family antitoxin domain-containing protein [Desulfotignum balticum]
MNRPSAPTKILLAFFVEMDNIYPTYKYIGTLLSMNEKKNKPSACEKARQIIREGGGMIKTSEAIQAGIHPRTLYQLRDMGDLEQLSRGIYRLAEIETVSNPDFVIVATRIPISVICLISALSFHEITTQIPHEVSVAIPKDSKPPVINYPPMQFHKFSAGSFRAGVESHQIDGVNIKVYSPEKTLADCFKFRNKIGMDVVLEALKLYKSRMKFDHKKILEYARICRVDKIVLPYLEANI